MIKTIGRYEIPINAVQLCQKRTGLKGFFQPGWDIVLTGGAKLYLTNAEKEELDRQRNLHSQIMEVMGMVHHLQMTNRPA